jgi:type I restriction enzyme, S subunit
VPPAWAGANIARAVARIAPVEAISSAYLVVAMRSDQIQSYFIEATRTLAQPTLNVGLIEVLPIPLPPIAEQHCIVDKVNELMALCDRLETSLTTGDDTRRLLDALLAEALAPAEALDREAAE